MAIRRIFSAIDRFIKAIVTFIILLALLGFVLYGASYLYLRWPAEHPKVEMTINQGTSVKQISEVLEKSGVIKCGQCFRIYVSVAGIAPKLRAGDYEFESGLTPGQVIEKLKRGDFKTYRLTIVEGWTVKQIADYLKTLPFLGENDFVGDFVELTNNPEYIKSLNIGWDVPNLEGYLFPSTYEVYKLKDPKKLISIMVGHFKSDYADLIKEKSKELNLSPEEVVTMASIIEKETSKQDEKPVVSSVFYNRLKKGMLLQTDPTVIYGLKNYDGNIRKRDLKNPHKYNTYVHPGLPPGPISNPGGESIKAAVNPASTEYLFFVSKNDGSHLFTKTYSEHQKGVYEYQIKRKK